MQLSVTITSLGGPLVIQDPHPVHGIFSKTVPALGAKTFTCDWDIWHRISVQVESYRAAGLCTVALSEVTPTGTDGTSGPNTTYNRSDWALLNSFRKDIGALQTAISAMPSPFLYKGSIAVNTSFPLIANVLSGWFYTITADVTDNAGATYTNTGLVFTPSEEIVWDGSTWVRLGKSLTGPFQLKGSIAIASDFPPPVATATTGVRDGYAYYCTAAVTDNDATKTNTGQAFLLGDMIVWRTSGWVVLSNANAMLEMGTIALSTDFPLVALVKRGYTYRVTAYTVDNAGATYTNTGLTFQAGDVIVWTGATWATLGDKETVQVASVTPIVVPAGDSVNFVDTATIAGPSAMALPAITAGMAGRSITVCDATGGAGANAITITPNATDTIDGVNAPIAINKNYASVTLQGVAVGKWKTVARAVPIASAATAAAVGVAAAGTSIVPSPDDHVHAHGNQLGGTLHADVVAGVSSGFMTAAQATTLAAIADDHVFMSVTGLDMKTDEHEHSGALNGLVGKRFLATHVMIKSSVNVGAVNADGTINIGTAADGAQIAAAIALTGIGAVDTARVFPLPAHAVPVAGNATLYVNVETAETGVGTLEIDVFVIGRQI
jgi:hypothetical protein